MPTCFNEAAQEALINLISRIYPILTRVATQFTSPEFSALLKNKVIQNSMNGMTKGVRDNLLAERLGETGKYEYIYLPGYHSVGMQNKA